MSVTLCFDFNTTIVTKTNVDYSITCGVLGVGVLRMGGVEDVDGQVEPWWEP